MDHFPASNLFEEISAFQDFQKADFETIWSDSKDCNSLSDEEKGLFPDNIMELDQNCDLFASDPFLGEPSSVLLDVPVMSSSVVNTVPNYPDFTSESDLDIENMLPMKVDDDDDDTTTITAEDIKPSASEIMFIHSYSQPQEQQTDTVDVEEDEEQETTTVIQTAQKPKTRNTRSASAKKSTTKSKKELHGVQTGRVSKRTRKAKKHFDESSDDEEEVEFTRKPKKALKAISGNNAAIETKENSNRKVKLYEMGAFDDPEMERCRQNAINAKINRDRKKKEKNGMQKEMAKLRQENLTLKKTNKKYKARMAAFEGRLQALEAIIRSNPQMDRLLKASGNASLFKAETAASSSSGSSGEEEEQEIIYYDD